jgi:fatty-acyl-CoA synthase
MHLIENSLVEFYEKQVTLDPDHEFVVYPDRNLRFTYGQFNERANNLAKGLLAIGIKKGDHVGIWAKNVPDWLTFMFATAKIGAVLVTVNTAYKSHEVEYILKQSNMKTLALIDSFQDVDYLRIIYGLLPELKKSERGRMKSKNFPCLKSLIYIGQEKHRGMYNSSELMLLGSHYPNDELRKILASLHGDNVINIQYTSGTTGFPKGVMLTSKNILNNGFSIGDRQKFTQKDRVCLPVPLFHCFGIVLGVMAVLTHRATLVMLEVFDPLLVLAAVQKERCTALYGVPTMFIAEYNHPMFDMFDLSSLRTGIMAGSVCPVDVMKKAMTDMHCYQITSVYGLTEASPGITQTAVDDPVELRAETVGKSFPGVEIRVINPSTNKPVATDMVGEICCRGYNVMKGYYKMPEETKEVIDEDGWLHSGDLGTCDEKGYYRITGRMKDMIIRGGENIYPREIEEFLHEVPGVKDSQVVGIPDKKYGEIVGAFVILKKGADLTEDDIRDYASSRISRYKVPKHIFFVDNYPLTASGKIQKYKLRELAVEILKKRERGSS